MPITDEVKKVAEATKEKASQESQSTWGNGYPKTWTQFINQRGATEGSHPKMAYVYLAKRFTKLCKSEKQGRIIAAGILGNIFYESGCYACSDERYNWISGWGKDGVYKKIADNWNNNIQKNTGTLKTWMYNRADGNDVPKGSYGATGFGVCQWSYGRRKKLFQWAQDHNYSVGNLRLQLAFLFHELTTDSSLGLSALKNCSSSRDAGLAFQKHFERPLKTQESRGTKASEYARRYASVDINSYSWDGSNSSGDSLTVDDNISKNPGGGGSGDSEPVVVYVPPKSVSVIDTEYAKKLKDIKTSLQEDLSTLVKYKTYEGKGKHTIASFEKNFKADKLTSINSAGKDSKLYKTKNSEGYSVQRVYDFYLTANDILSNFSTPKNSATKTAVNNFKDEIYRKYMASKLKYDQIKNSKSSIYDTNTWQEYLSTFEGTESVDNLKTTQSTVEKQISEIIEKYNTDLQKELENKKSYESAINEMEKEISLIAPEYNLITKEYNQKNNISQQIQERLITDFNNNFSNEYKYWNQFVLDNPSGLLFWFDFLDTNGTMDEYSIPNVGDRTKAVNETGINAIYYKDIPQLIYYTEDNEDMDFSKTGYNYVKIGNSMDSLFIKSGRGTSAKETVDNLLYNYGYCTEQIQLNTVPIYYLEPNTRIFIYDELSHLEGEYLVERMTLPITYNGTMSIDATKAPERLY